MGPETVFVVYRLVNGSIEFVHAFHEDRYATWWVKKNQDEDNRYRIQKVVMEYPDEFENLNDLEAYLNFTHQSWDSLAISVSPEGSFHIYDGSECPLYEGKRSELEKAMRLIKYYTGLV